MIHNRWHIARLGLRTLIYAALASALVWLFGTNAGLAWVWHMAKPFLPQNLHVASVSGRLIGPITIKGVNYRSADMHVTLKRAHLEWSPSHLFVADLTVPQLDVDGLHIERLKPSPPHGTAASARPPDLSRGLHLPVFVHVRHLRVTDFSYQSAPGATPFRIDSLRLAARYDQRGAQISGLQLQAPRIDARGRLSVGPRDAHPVEGHIDWRLKLADYAPVPGITRLSGTLEHLVVDQHLGAPYHVNAHVALSGLIANLRWRGTIRVDGLQLQRVAQHFQPLKVSLEAHGEGGLKQLQAGMQAHVDSPRYGKLNARAKVRYRHRVVNLQQVLLQVPGKATQVQLQGNVALGATPRASVQAQWKALAWPLNGPAKFGSPQGRLNVSGSLKDLVAGVQAKVNGGGELNATLKRQGERMTALLDWHGLRYPGKNPRFTSARGHAQLIGRLDDYTLKMAADLGIPKRMNGHVELAGHGDRHALDLSTLDVSALRGHIAGKGRLAWQPTPAATLDLHGSGLDPGILLPQWQGKLDVALKADAQLEGGKPQGRVEQLRVHGRLRHQPFKLTLQGNYHDQQLKLAQLALASGRNRLDAQGMAGRKSVDLRWRIDAPQLDQLMPGAGGSVRGHGRVQGATERPHAQLQLHAQRLRYDTYQVGKLAVDGDVDLTGAASSHLDVSLGDAEVRGVQISAASLKASGRPVNHTLRLAVDSSRGNMDIRLAGGVDSAWTRWQGQLEQATIAPAHLAPWRLRSPMAVSLGRSGAHLARGCWHTGSAQLCLQGSRTPDGTEASLQLQALPTAYLQHLLPSGADLQGQISGRGHFQTRPGRQPSADVQIKLSGGALVQKSENGSTRTLLSFQRSEARLTLGPKGMDLAADVALAQGGIHAQAHVGTGTKPLAQRPLQGRVTLDLESLDFASALVSKVSGVDGTVHGKMQVGGTLASPALDGQLKLSNGRAKLLPAGIDLTGLNLDLLSRGQHLTLKAQAHSGGGTLGINAQGDIGSATRLSAKVNGQNFQVMNTAVARVQISPQLDIVARDKRVHVNGQVKVPRADITPHELPKGSNAVTVSSDQVIVHSQSSPQSKLAPAWKIYADVRVILGDDVKFKGFGMKAKLGGSLKTHVEPGKPPSGSGQLVIEKGHYQAYGQDLTIKDGRVLFAGPLNEPGLDVRATRQPRAGILVGVHVKGPLKNPQFELYSDPSMSQNEQLSWLVLGRPVSSTSGHDSNVLAQAALALGIKGGNFLAGGIGKELGLGDVTIESGPLTNSQAPTGSANPFAPRGTQAGSASGQQASLMLGKYLSPKLYVSYGLGLLQQAYVVKLQYLLSSKLTLQTEASSLSSGVDLLYSIERGNP